MKSLGQAVGGIRSILNVDAASGMHDLPFYRCFGCFPGFSRRQPREEMSGRGPVISFQGAPSGVVSEADLQTPVEMETISLSESSPASDTVLDSGSPPSSCSHVVRFWMRKELRTRGCGISGAAEW